MESVRFLSKMRSSGYSNNPRAATGTRGDAGSEPGLSDTPSETGDLVTHRSKTRGVLGHTWSVQCGRTQNKVNVRLRG